MIYGKITLEDWRTACVNGEEPESSFESYNLRLFFYGTLYNRDVLQANPDDSNAKLAADAFLSGLFRGFSCLDGSFTIVYYSENESGVVRDHHGTHYPVYCTADGNFATSWQFLKEQSEEILSYNPISLSAFLQSGFLKASYFPITHFESLEAGQKFCMQTETGFMAPLLAIVKSIKPTAKFPHNLDLLKEKSPALYEKVKSGVHCLRRDNVFCGLPRIVVCGRLPVDNPFQNTF